RTTAWARARYGRERLRSASIGRLHLRENRLGDVCERGAPGRAAPRRETASDSPGTTPDAPPPSIRIRAPSDAVPWILTQADARVPHRSARAGSMSHHAVGPACRTPLATRER